MSKRDYIAIAAIVRECMDAQCYTVALYQSMLVSKLCVYFKGKNDLFSSAKFRAACYGKEEDEKAL